jgi:hypothetical protein
MVAAAIGFIISGGGILLYYFMLITEQTEQSKATAPLLLLPLARYISLKGQQKYPSLNSKILFIRY